MRSTRRKMGNSTGIVVPSAALREAGLASGAVLDVSVEAGRIVATPVVQPTRAGWAEDAALLAQVPLAAEEAEWLGVPNEGDTETRTPSTAALARGSSLPETGDGKPN